MPSEARKTFDHNSRDIDALLQLDTKLSTERLGPDVLAKSAVVLITAFWEAYCEDLAAEALAHLVNYAESWEVLPLHLKKVVAKELESDKNELAAWSLAAEGWRNVLQDRLSRLQEERNRKLNTPKTSEINDLFEKAVGIQSISSRWKGKGMSSDSAESKLDNYVRLRGDIAHRGAASDKVKVSTASEYIVHVRKLVSATGAHVNSVVRRATGKPLWTLPLTSLFPQLNQRKLTEFLNDLGATECEVLQMRFGLRNGRIVRGDREVRLTTLVAVADRLGLTPNRVRLLESRTLADLRVFLRNS